MSTIEDLLSQQMIERLGWMLIHFVWQAAVVAVLLAVMLRLLRRSSSNVRYAAACAAIGLIVLLPLVTMQQVEVTRPAAEAGPPPATLPAAVTPVQVVQVTELPASPVTNVAPLEKASVVTSIPWKERFVSRLAPALPCLVLGWLVGVFGLSAWHLGGWAQLQRLKRRMVRPVADAVQTRLSALAERLGIHRAVGLLESMLVEVPTVVGWIKPVILLPASALTGLSGEQLEAILTHELAHIRRYDYLVNILQTVVEILGFYHPALWWVSHRIRVERENCCDDLAVRICGDSVRYARALTHLEEMRHSRTEWAVAATGGSLISRIARLLGRPIPDDRRFTWLPGLIALLLVAALVIPLVCSVPVRARPELAEGASKEVPNGVTADKTESNRADATKDATQEPGIRLEFILAEVFADRVLDSNTAGKMASLMYQYEPTDSSTNERSHFTAREATLREVSRPLGEVLTTFDARAGNAGVVLNLLLSGGYAEIVGRPTVLANDGQPATVTIGNPRDPNDPKASQQADELNLRLTFTPTIHPTVWGDITLEGAFDPVPCTDGRTTDDSGSRRSVALTKRGSTLLHPAGLTQRVDREGRKRLPLLLVEATITNAPRGQTQTFRDATSSITTEVQSVPAAQEASTGQIKFELIMADLYADKVLDEDIAPQVFTMLFHPSSGRMRGASLPISTVFPQTVPDVEQSEALAALLESRGYASVHKIPALSMAFDQSVSISMADLPASSDPNHPSGTPKPWFNVSISARSNTNTPNSIWLRAELDLRQPDGTPIGTVDVRDFSSITATIDEYTCWSLPYHRMDREGRSRQLVLFVKPTVISRPSGGATFAGGMAAPAGGVRRGGGPVMAGTVPARGVPTPAEPSRRVEIDFILADLFADRVVDAETGRQIANLLYRRTGGSVGLPPEPRPRPSPAELRKPLDQVFADYPPEPNQARALIDVLASRGFGQMLKSPARFLLAKRRIFVRRFGDSREPDDPNADNANELAFGAVMLPNIDDSNQTVSLHLQFLQPLVLSHDPNGAPPVNRAAATLPNGIYQIVQANFAVHTDKDGNRRRPYLLAKATFLKPEESALPQQDSRPAATTRDANDSNGQILSRFVILRVRPERKVDQQTARELSRILEKPLDSAENAPMRQVLQIATDASADQFAAALKVLDSSGYVEVLLRPAILTPLGKRGQINIDGDPNNAQQGETVTGWKLGVLAEEVKDKYAVKMAVDLDLRLTKILSPPPGWTGDAKDLPRSTQSTTNHVTLEVPNGKCAVQVLSGITQGAPADPNSEAIYLMASAVVNKETQASVEPATNLKDSLRLAQSAGHGADVNDANGQILSKFIIAKVRAERKVDLQTAVELGSVLKRPWKDIETCTVGQLLQMATDTTPAQQLAATINSLPVDAAEQFAAAIKLLSSGGYVEVLSRPMILTRAGQAGQIRIGGDPNDAKPGETTIDLKLGVIAQKPKDKLVVQLDVDIDLRLTKIVPPGVTVNPQAPIMSVQSTTNPVRLEAADGRWIIQPLRAVTQGPPADPNTEVIYLMASPTIPKPTAASKEEPKDRVPAVQIAPRLMWVSDETLNDIRQGRLTSSTFSSDDVKVLQQIGERIARQERIILEETQLNLVLKATQQDTQTSVLTTPRVTAIVGEPVDFSIREQVPYTAGYTEPADGGQPIPKVEHIAPPVQWLMTARLTSDGQIAIDANVTLTGVESFQEKAYRDKLTYKIPQVYTLTVPLKDVLIPDGKTALIVGPRAKKVRLSGDPLKDEQPLPLLILITATRVEASELPPGPMGGMMGAAMNGPSAEPRREGGGADAKTDDLSRRIAGLEADLIALRQILAPQNPEIVQKKSLLDAYQKELTESQGDPQARERALLQARVNELSRRIGDLDIDLTETGQKLTPQHPEMVRKRALLDAYKKELTQSQSAQENLSDKRTSTSLPLSGDQPSSLAQEPTSSRAWTIMRQPNCPPLLLGLTQQLAKLTGPSQRNSAGWREVAGGSSVKLDVTVEQDTPGEIVVGFFKDAKWMEPPVAVRRLPGPGVYTLTGLPAGVYQIGAMIGPAFVPKALGVQRTWPQAVEITSGRTASTELLLSREFQKWASGWWHGRVTQNSTGLWGIFNRGSLLRGRVSGPDGKPLPFVLVQVREHQDVRQGGIAAPDLETDENGAYRFDGVKWPYTVSAVWEDPLPSMFGARHQQKNLSRVFKGPQEINFEFGPFPPGVAKVAGRVVDQFDKPITMFFLDVRTPDLIKAIRAGKDQNPDGQTHTEFGYMAPFTSNDGSFELDGLPEGAVLVRAIPFDSNSFEISWGDDAVLKAGMTMNVQVRLTRKNVLYGKVQFEDGSPAAIKPAPWPGAATTILIYTRLTGRVESFADNVGTVDEDGCFAACLGEKELEAIRSGASRLMIRLPEKPQGRLQMAGEFPLEKLSEDKAKAGVVTIKRPQAKDASTPSVDVQ